MTNFKDAFDGLNKTKRNELNTIINEFDTFYDDIDDYVTDTELTSYVTTTALTTALASYVTSTGLTTTLAGYAKIVAAPATAASTGTAGQIAYDATHIYVCVATDTWVRADLATWT